MTYNPQHTNFVGYRGLVLLDNVLLLASSGDVTFAAAPIKSSANWGAGSWNAAETVAWSADMPTIDANIECDVTTTAIGKIEEFSKRYKVSDQNGGTPVSIHPTNSWGFEGKAFCDSLSLKCAEKQNLTASIKCKAYATDSENGLTYDFDPLVNGEQRYGVNRQTGDLGIPNAGLDNTAGTLLQNVSGYAQLQGMAYNALYPYWFQRVYLALQKDTTPSANGKEIPRIALSNVVWGNAFDGISDWNATLNHNIQFKKTCCMRSGAPAASGGWPLAPDYVALGAMTGDCSLTFVGTLNEFDYNYYYHTRSFAAAFDSPAETDTPTSKHTVIIPAMTCESYPMSLQTGNDIITANFSYTAVGNGTDPPALLGAWDNTVQIPTN